MFIPIDNKSHTHNYYQIGNKQRDLENENSTLLRQQLQEIC